MARKYQQEIEEILQQVNEGDPSGGEPRDSGSGKRPASARGQRRESSRFSLRLIPIISPGRLVIAGISFLLVALILRTAVSGVSGPLTMVGIGLFVVAYILFFVRLRPPVERRWRGRSMEDESPPAWWDKLRDWLRRS